MTLAELRDLRVHIMHGYRMTDEQALAVVSALEDVTSVVEREIGPPVSAGRVYCCEYGEPCSNAPCVNGIIVALREAGPLP